MWRRDENTWLQCLPAGVMIMTTDRFSPLTEGTKILLFAQISCHILRCFNRTDSFFRNSSKTFHQPAELLGRQGLYFRFVSWPDKLSLLQTFVQQKESVAFPIQRLNPVSLSAAEQKQCCLEWIHPKLCAYHAGQAINPAPQIRITAGNVHWAIAVEVIQHRAQTRNSFRKSKRGFFVGCRDCASTKNRVWHFPKRRRIKAFLTYNKFESLFISAHTQAVV